MRSLLLYSRFRSRRTMLVVALLPAVLLGGTTLLQAQQSGTVPPPAGSSDPGAGAKKVRFVKFDSPLYERKPTGSGLVHTGSEGVVITSEDTELRTDKATYNESSKIAFAPGTLELNDPQNRLTGDKGTANYGTRDAEITGNVKITVKPKPSDQDAPEGSMRREFKDPVLIFCDRVRYNWRTRKAILTGHLTIKQKDRTITGERGLYDGQSETVELVGNIRSVRPNGEQVVTDGPKARAIAVIKQGAETFRMIGDTSMPGDKGKIKAVIPVEDEEETAPAPPPKPEEPTSPQTHGDNAP